MGFLSPLSAFGESEESSESSSIRASGGPERPLRNNRPAAFPYPISVDSFAAARSAY